MKTTTRALAMVPVLGVFLGGILAVQLGWRGSFAVMAIIALLFIVLGINQLVAALQPGLGRLAMVDGAGHYPHVQFPQQTLAVVLPFLAEVDRPSADA